MAELHEAPPSEEKWFAVKTVPRHEKAVMVHLERNELHALLPTYSSVRVWKNRQSQTITLPLFPTYLFVRVRPQERAKVLSAPGARHIIGNSRGPLPVEEAEVEALRRTLDGHKIEPFTGLAVGKKVRVVKGAMRGLEGILIRQNKSLRLIISVQLINQHAAVEVDASMINLIED